MRLVEVDVLPAKNRKGRDRIGKNHKLYDFLDEFIDMGVKVAKVELEESDYHSVDHAINSLTDSIRHHRYPIKVVRRGDDIYFVRKDI